MLVADGDFTGNPNDDNMIEDEEHDADAVSFIFSESTMQNQCFPCYMMSKVGHITFFSKAPRRKYAKIATS